MDEDQLNLLCVLSILDLVHKQKTSFATLDSKHPTWLRNAKNSDMELTDLDSKQNNSIRQMFLTRTLDDMPGCSVNRRTTIRSRGSRGFECFVCSSRPVNGDIIRLHSNTDALRNETIEYKTVFDVSSFSGRLYFCTDRGVFRKQPRKSKGDIITSHPVPSCPPGCGCLYVGFQAS